MPGTSFGSFEYIGRGSGLGARGSGLGARKLDYFPSSPAPQFLKLSKGEIEPPLEWQAARRGTRLDARHPVVAQARCPAEHEGVSGFETQFLDRSAAPQTAEQEARRVA